MLPREEYSFVHYRTPFPLSTPTQQSKHVSVQFSQTKAHKRNFNIDAHRKWHPDVVLGEITETGLDPGSKAEHKWGSAYGGRVSSRG